MRPTSTTSRAGASRRRRRRQQQQQHQRPAANSSSAHAFIALISIITWLHLATGHLAWASYLPAEPPVVSPFSFGHPVAEGARVSRLCSISSGDQPLHFSWLKDGQPINDLFGQQAQPRHLGHRQPAHQIVVSQPDSGESILKIDRVRLEHAGNYTCVVRNRAGMASYSSQLQVNSEPRWLVEPRDGPIVARKGQTIVIDCHSTGFPKPQQIWQIKSPTSNEFEPLAATGRISLAANGSLIIRNADKQDEANYLCKSFNGVGRALQWSTTLKVTVPAHFEAPQDTTSVGPSNLQTIVVRKQEQVQLRCDALGDEPITMEWFKNKQRLTGSENGARYRIHNQPLQNGLISVLVIAQAQRQDNGVYECITRNPAGRDKLQKELIVQEEPDNIQELQATQINSRSVTLMWNEPYDGRSPITNYMFQFKKVAVESSPSIGLGIGPTVGDSAMDLTMLESSAAPGGYAGGYASGERVSTGPISPPTVASDDDWQQAQRLTLAVQQPVGPNPSQNSSTASPPTSLVRSITIEKLEPASKYVLRALAANRIGPSKFSQPMEFTTEEEAPEVAPLNVRAVPLNSTSVHVSWDEIPRHFGRIDGYYIGYRLAPQQANATAHNFVNKPFMSNDLLHNQPQLNPSQSAASNSAIQVSVGSAQAPSVQRLETTIHDLRRDTVYEITVMAFNAHGSGPSSDFVLARTNEMDPPRPVKVTVRRESNESIFIEWQRDPNDQNPVDVYELFQERNMAAQELFGLRLPGNTTQFKAPGLKCGSRYQFYVIAHNKVGKSEPSEIVGTSTSGLLPQIPTKMSLIKMVNSTCLLVNLNAFQDRGCRIKSFSVRYRVEHAGPNGSALGSTPGAPAGSAGAGTTGALVSANGMMASHQAFVMAGKHVNPANIPTNSAGSATTPVAEWTTIRPKSTSTKQQFANEEDGMEYLCGLSPVGEYTIHVAATTDIGRSEAEYTVLMSSDELRHSTLRELFELVANLPNIFAYVPSIIVFLLAGLFLSLVTLFLYTTFIKYYQKFVIMHNQIRAARRAKRDEKRRQKLQQSRHNQKLAELWADDYEDENDDDDESANKANFGGRADDDDDEAGFGGFVSGGFHGSLDDGADDEDNGDESSVSGGLNRKVHNMVPSQQLKKQHQPNSGHRRRRQSGQHQRGRSLQGQQYPSNAGYYTGNISNSAFDSSSIDSPCNGAGKYPTSGHSTCLSTASTDSIHGRFQCLNSKQYVKMNEYTMLPSISANLQNDIYGVSAGGTASSASPSHGPMMSNAHQIGPISSAAAAAAANQYHYSTLRRTNMQTYLPPARRPQQTVMAPGGAVSAGQSAIHPCSAANLGSTYGYYMSPPQQANRGAATMATNESANSIFVPPQQIIYSAPNIRRQAPVFL